MRFVYLLLLCALSLTATAGVAPEFASYVAFEKGDPSPTLVQLRGKTVIMIFFQSWCPICNKWSPQLIKQLEDVYGNDRSVVLLGIKTDGDVASGKAYIKERGDPTRWLIASDAEAAYVTKVMGKDELWQYAVVDPDGLIVSKGKAGMRYSGSDFALPKEAYGAKFSARANVLFSAGVTFPDGTNRAALLAEIGSYAEAGVSLASVPKPAADTFRHALMTAMDTQVTTWSAQVTKLDTPAADRYLAYHRLREAAVVIKGSPSAKDATKALAEAGKDKAMKREIEAEATWLEIVTKAKAVPLPQRTQALTTAWKQLATKYDGTWIGQWAKAQADDAQQ